MIDQLYDHTSWLYVKFFENRIFFIDFWSIAHFWTGAVLFFLFQAFGVRKKWLWIILILLLYEVAEILFLFFALNVFRTETFKDQFTDILLGLAGAFIAQLVLKRKHDPNKTWPLVPDGVALFSSATIAFIWVGNYNYHYNHWFLNSPGINYWAYINWVFWGYVTLKVYLWLKHKTRHFYIAIFIVWALFFTGLLGVEAFGYHVLSIHEDSLTEAPPLVLGLIHGSKICISFISFILSCSADSSRFAAMLR